MTTVRASDEGSPRFPGTKRCIALSVAAGLVGLALVWTVPQPPPDAGLKDRLETLKRSDIFLGKN